MKINTSLKDRIVVVTAVVVLALAALSIYGKVVGAVFAFVAVFLAIVFVAAIVVVLGGSANGRASISSAKAESNAVSQVPPSDPEEQT